MEGRRPQSRNVGRLVKGQLRFYIFRISSYWLSDTTKKNTKNFDIIMGLFCVNIDQSILIFQVFPPDSKKIAPIAILSTFGKFNLPHTHCSQLFRQEGSPPSDDYLHFHLLDRGTHHSIICFFDIFQRHETLYLNRIKKQSTNCKKKFKK